MAITYSIDNSKVYPVTAQADCRRILVREDCNSASQPTADLVQFDLLSGSEPGQTPVYRASGIKVAKGTPAIFAHKSFHAGETVGGIQTAAGSITLQQIESFRI